MSEENGEQMPLYFMLVSLPESNDSDSRNWTVLRRLSEFQNLHRKLSEASICRVHFLLLMLSSAPITNTFERLKFTEAVCMCYSIV